MSDELTIFRTGGQVSTAFSGINLPSERLDDGVSAGFAKVSYKASKWGIKYQGAYTPIEVRMPDGSKIQSPYLDVVILRAGGHPSKAWYEDAYREGDSAPPDCWSTNGIVPDAGVSPSKKQHDTCIGCRWNAWGSKVNRDTGEATRGKACMDSKRTAVVPVGDIMNVTYGGPMMLNFPPTSLKRLGPYQNMLAANGFHYAQVWTRVTFEPPNVSAFPLFKLDAINALSDVQAAQVIKQFDHPLIDRILNTEMQVAEAWDDPRATIRQMERAQPAATPSKAALTPEQQRIADLEAMLAKQGQAQPEPPPPPAPPPLSPEQQRIRELEAQLTKTTLLMPDQSQQAKPAEPAVVRAQPTQPANTGQSLPPGMVLPPGVTAEAMQAALAVIAAQQDGKPKGRGRGRPPGGPRTPPVQPTNMESAPAQASLAGSALPEPVGMPAPASPAPGNGHDATQDVGAADAAVAQIMGTIKDRI